MTSCPVRTASLAALLVTLLLTGRAEAQAESPDSFVTTGEVRQRLAPLADYVALVTDQPYLIQYGLHGVVANAQAYNNTLGPGLEAYAGSTPTRAMSIQRTLVTLRAWLQTSLPRRAEAAGEARKLDGQLNQLLIDAPLREYADGLSADLPLLERASARFNREHPEPIITQQYPRCYRTNELGICVMSVWWTFRPMIQGNGRAARAAEGLADCLVDANGRIAFLRSLATALQDPETPLDEALQLTFEIEVGLDKHRQVVKACFIDDA